MDDSHLLDIAQVPSSFLNNLKGQGETPIFSKTISSHSTLFLLSAFESGAGMGVLPLGHLKPIRYLITLLYGLQLIPPEVPHTCPTIF